MTDAKKNNTEPGPKNIKGDTSIVLEELSRKNVAKPRSTKSGLRRFSIVLLVLVPVTAAVAFLFFEQAKTMAVLAELRSENAALTEAIANVEMQTPAPAAPVTVVEPFQLPDNLVDTRMLEELRSTVDNRVNALAQNAAIVQERLNALPQERLDLNLLRRESEYLLRLANQKLQLEGDGDSAYFILSAVDEMLSESGDTSVVGVRDILAGEMLALRAMDYVDVNGLYARLNNLMPLIERLSLREVLLENYNAQLAQTRAASVVSSDSLFDRSLAVLESIFVWRSWEEAPEALLTAPQEAVLKQNLRLMLEQGQLALLMREPEVYRDSLRKAADWTARYFALDESIGSTIQQELSTLAQASIVATRPDISRSLELLQQLGSPSDQPVLLDGQ